ncbi:unnamed protein product [Psylliodes chrysocephalus]|uniref:Carboxylic ester hydrolase n=1 Tax=Psylliodes chrysocephalus TaxID=3402493 RepID=A0A9P0CQY3_9CUCU|nr:unnamed protein product [Psylliodes chrysocephala]
MFVGYRKMFYSTMSLPKVVILSIFCIANVQCHYNREPLVSTNFGDLKGSILTSRLGKSIYSFRGIRYAEPPVKELRFKPPVPIEHVEGIYDATKDGPSCPQPGYEPVSEDCLFLNVYTTKLPHGKYNPKRPVIVFIHSGGFYSSTSDSSWLGPHYFLDQDIVLVSFNYRIGTLGFLSTGDKEAPGNNGFKDQIVVLKWVQKNIEKFGGDPNSVTILGYSAGGWSLVLHMLSPLSEGLFHKGGSLSGSPLGIWPIPYNQTDIAKKQARILGCPDDTTANIVKCLKTKSADDLGNSLLQFREYGSWLLLIWSPVIEPDVGEPRFLSDHPIRLIKNGHMKQIPYICGRTTEEVSYFANDILKNRTLTKELNDDFEKIAPVLFLYERNTNFSKRVSRKIKNVYFHDRPIDWSQETNFKELYEDAVVGFQMHRAAKLISEYNKYPVYYYKFTYPGRYSFAYKDGTNNTIPYGVVHHDDLIYLFYNSKLFPLFKEHGPKEIEMVEKLTMLYANFARTGNPTPGRSEALDNTIWEPYNLTERKYLDIGKRLVVKEKLNENRFEVWEKLYPIQSYLEQGNKNN